MERDSSRLSHVFKNLHPVIVAVSHINLIVRANRHTARQTKFTGANPAAADIQQTLAGQIKNLEIIKNSVSHIHMFKSIHRYPFGTAEMAGRISVAAEFRNEASLQIENLHSAIHRVGYQ